MPDQLPPTTTNDLTATSLSPCCNTRLELSSPPFGYECRNCMQTYDLQSGDTAASDENEGDTTRRDPEYVTEGLCGYYNPQSMDSPCSRASGWGRDTNTGPCKTHHQ